MQFSNKAVHLITELHGSRWVCRRCPPLSGWGIRRSEELSTGVDSYYDFPLRMSFFKVTESFGHVA